jgi:hypothetical protein
MNKIHLIILLFEVTHPYIHTRHRQTTFQKPLFIFREALNTEICQNLETDFLRDHNTFPNILHMKAEGI